MKEHTCQEEVLLSQDHIAGEDSELLIERLMAR